MNEFPIIFPDYRTHSQTPRMVLTGTENGQAVLVGMRDLTPDEETNLSENWLAYLEARTEWLVWAKQFLRPASCFTAVVAGVSRSGRMTSGDISWMLDYQTK